MSKFEAEAKEQFEYFSRVWLRYLDDIFAVFDTNVVRLGNFESRLNNRCSTIKLTFERQNSNKIPFLDVLQNSIGEWVSEHRQHHKYSDTDADPHNSRRGFFFSHVGSLMMEKHPEVVRRTKEIDNRDIFEDPLVAFHERHYFVFRILFGVVLPSIIPPMIWGESWILSVLVILFPKYVICLNMIFCVNSVAHLWGTKPYNKNINSTENALVSFLTIGEGYHNYHHTFPWDYRTSEVGKYLNVTMHLLDFFHKLGWAYDMKTASPELVKKVVENKGDNSHYKWGREIPEENFKSL